ncbi:MAG: hypothetical protein IPP37_12660 [Saprospiraceae bacterium]|nr:hypothetical protein [Saprospiraceae bacterium]
MLHKAYGNKIQQFHCSFTGKKYEEGTKTDAMDYFEIEAKESLDGSTTSDENAVS